MAKEYRKCIVNGRLGIIMKRWTHTSDVWFPKTGKTMNIKTSLLKLLPKEQRKNSSDNQLKLF